jgi:hypothetical protein
MKPSCPSLSIQSALLEAARAGTMPEPEMLAHVDDCDDCRTAIERLRRMVSVWVAEEDQEDERAIIAAAARFEQRAGRPRPPTWQGIVPFAFAGAFAGAALLFATIRVRPPAPSASAGSQVRIESAPTAAAEQRGAWVPFDSAKPSVVSVPHVRGPRGVARLANGLRVDLRAGETATVQLEGGKSSELKGPCAVEFWASASDVGGWRLSPIEPATSGIILEDSPAETVLDTRLADGRAPREVAAVATAVAPSAKAPERGAAATSHETTPIGERAEARAASNVPTTAGDPKVERAWARAADALRRDDFDTADSAFADLGRSTDAATRDAARLARAQLWMAHGRGAAVRPVLVELAARGATALVRQRAAEFLAPPGP